MPGNSTGQAGKGRVVERGAGWRRRRHPPASPSLVMGVDNCINRLGRCRLSRSGSDSSGLLFALLLASGDEQEQVKHAVAGDLWKFAARFVGFPSRKRDRRNVQVCGGRRLAETCFRFGQKVNKVVRGVRNGQTTVAVGEVNGSESVEGLYCFFDFVACHNDKKRDRLDDRMSNKMFHVEHRSST